ncbi:MAG: tRNA-dihydrouridine synthase [Thermoleophilia bacterium]|nr:tRNA-dihydrouridine synthase [Thermoleophilia bacterium]
MAATPSSTNIESTSMRAPIDLTGTSFLEQLTGREPDVDLGAPFTIGVAGTRVVEIDGRVALAPMAGVSVQAFRRQGRRFGANVVFTEMVSISGLHYANERTRDYLRIATDEHPIAVQLFGTDPKLMFDAAQQVAESGADMIDINMGCPVKKVAKTGAGCALLDDHDTAVAVARACVEATDLPVTIKIRRGMKNGSRDCLTLGPRLVEEAGVSALTIHPRSAAQMYTGFADHALTAELVELVNVPVFASGDITDRVRAEATMALTGCAAVMVGRAAQGNPWAVRDLASGTQVEPEAEERVAELVRFIREVTREMPEQRASGFLRKFYGWYLRGGAFGRQHRRDLMELDTTTQVQEYLLSRWPAAEPRLAELERTVRYPDDTDSIIELPVSIYGGG